MHSSVSVVLHVNVVNAVLIGVSWKVIIWLSLLGASASTTVT